MKKDISETGFTLIELLVVVLIVAILAALAAPTMDNTIKRNSINALQKDYLNALIFARSEAVSRNKRVSMCPSDDSLVCDTGTGNWSGGWLIFIDDGAGVNFGNGILDAGEELLRAFEYNGRSNASIVDPDNSGSDLSSLSWNFRGFVQNEQRALVVVCDNDNTASLARGLLIERSGRVIFTQDVDADGDHESAFEDSTGASVTANLSCS